LVYCKFAASRDVKLETVYFVKCLNQNNNCQRQYVQITDYVGMGARMIFFPGMGNEGM